VGKFTTKEIFTRKTPLRGGIIAPFLNFLSKVSGATTEHFCRHLNGNFLVKNHFSLLNTAAYF
jgi:hypothetical protein